MYITCLSHTACSKRCNNALQRNNNVANIFHQPLAIKLNLLDEKLYIISNIQKGPLKLHRDLLFQTILCASDVILIEIKKLWKNKPKNIREYKFKWKNCVIWKARWLISTNCLITKANGCRY